MKVISTHFVDPFVMKIGNLFYYEFSKLPDSYSTLCAISDRFSKEAWVLVFGTINVVEVCCESNGTLCFAEGLFCFLPYIDLVNVNKMRISK
jgi:hypothetical protein